jgi:hypothetical protein
MSCRISHARKLCEMFNDVRNSKIHGSVCRKWGVVCLVGKMKIPYKGFLMLGIENENVN